MTEEACSSLNDVCKTVLSKRLNLLPTDMDKDQVRLTQVRTG